LNTRMYPKYGDDVSIAIRSLSRHPDEPYVEITSDGEECIVHFTRGQLHELRGKIDKWLGEGSSDSGGDENGA